MTTILAPVDMSTAVQTGPRMFRKQILRKAAIDYPTGDGKTRRVVFDDKYLTDLAASFNAGAYDDVPFILAGADNAHTMDPTRWRGWVKSVEVTPDGLDAILELSADAAELVKATGGKLGVSPRIKPVQHVDGRSFPIAINHVLGTLDQRQQGPTLGLRPWQPLDLAADDDGDVLDLTGTHYQEGTIMPKTLDLSTMTDDQLDGLRTWAAINDIDLAEPVADDDDELEPDDLEAEPEPGDDEGDPDDEPDDYDDEAEPITDADLDALIDAELADQGLEVAMSTDDYAPDALDLAAGDYADTADAGLADRREAATMRGQLAAQKYAQAGVPVYLIDLAMPLLAMSDTDADTLDLASPVDGAQIDVRGIVRDILDGVAGTIDLSREQGHGDDDADRGDGDDTTARWVDHIENNS